MLALARANPPPNEDPLLPSVLPKCTTRRHADEIHGRLVTSGVLLHPSATSRLILHLCSYPSASVHLLARRLLPIHLNAGADPFLYNALIKASSHGPDPLDALIAFTFLLSSGLSPDPFSFSLSLTAAARASSLPAGSQLHALVLKTGLAFNLYLQNVLIGFYSKCGLCEAARQVFDRMLVRDSVSWNSMVDAYVRAGKLGSALEVFYAMGDDKKNLISWNSIIGGYARFVDGIGIARELFDQMPARDNVSWNLMIDGYVKCGMMAEALKLFEEMPERDVIAWASVIKGYMEVGNIELGQHLFDEMPERDVITWNIMITGYAKNGKFTEALLLFIKMRMEGRIIPDGTTLVTTLSAISELGRIHDGICIHKYIRMKHLSLSGKLGVALIDMYSKCGRLEKALQVFETSAASMIECDACSSSSYVLLSNLYAGCGMWEDARRIRMMMKKKDFRKIPGCSWIELDGTVHEFVILRILKAHALVPEIPEDLYHLIKKAVAIRKHLERNRKDKDSKFRLILVESRIHRLARYYKRTKKLPPVWKYESTTAGTLVA
ncbi:hypothetical protein J5N97_025538 [Dioscorea zingiberensis]|uniref:Pentatricopeptide repeat-containing protein n=1 Tax=Dioscorea zingiberensis TaxID=325984 RepID=A0A9D5C8G0_9LILI|nr:hypothetical protein J5N97_025538 [Dioscorea zingiberensis]